jgi:LysM repeat protein
MKLSMHRKKNTAIRIMLLVSILLLAFTFQVTAQEEENLLTNPGFEEPYRMVDGNREVASGWNPWHIPRTEAMPLWQNAQPEYGQTAPDATRIRSGNNAQKFYNNTWNAHDGGVFQRITDITPATELLFSVYVYVWSSAYEDVETSEEPGEVTVQVGIDPTGGTDPASSNIVWSFAVPQYDAYRQYSIGANAASNAVTVFVRSHVDFPAQNSFVYLDDAVLAVAIPTEAPEDTNTPVPTDVPVEPTDVPVDTNTPVPTDVPVEPTDVPVDTDTPTDVPVEPTDVPAAPVPTDVPIEPTDEPTPTRENDENNNVATEAPILPTNTEVAVGGSTDSEFPGMLTHVVHRGDNVGRLAVLYGSTIEAIREANSLDEEMIVYIDQTLLIPVRLAAPVISTPTFTPEPTATMAEVVSVDTDEEDTYLVQPGETLSGIARRFNTTVEALAQANGIANINLVEAGQILTIPAMGGPTEQPEDVVEDIVEDGPTTYIVKAGDNLYRISLSFNVTMRQLSDANGISDVNLLFIGQVLIIP